MNKETANHLTKLFLRSAPIQRDGNQAWTHPHLSHQHMLDLIKPIEDRNREQAQQAEIRAAASERREAAGFACGICHRDAHSVAWHPYGGFAQILFAICEPEIEMAIRRDNGRRLAEYEAYRLACEQGVAVPPAV